MKTLTCTLLLSLSVLAVSCSRQGTSLPFQPGSASSIPTAPAANLVDGRLHAPKSSRVFSEEGNSDAAHSCQQGGYAGLVGAPGFVTFENCGECVSFAAHGGKFATGIIVPAGHTVSFIDPFFTACNALTYGYQLNADPIVPLASKSYGCFDQSVAGITIGPFTTAKILRVFLQDRTCGALYYSHDTDGSVGNHAYVGQLTSSSYQVEVTDSGGYCESNPGQPRPPTGNRGNINVTVQIN